MNKQSGMMAVMESFYTIQGEGAYQGKAAYFIRLAGCDVGCVWCDVKESWDAGIHPSFAVNDIVGKAIAESSPSEKSVFAGKSSKQLIVGQDEQFEVYPSKEKDYDVAINGAAHVYPTASNLIAVVTGGEPLLQDCTALTSALQENGFATHMETSGAYAISGQWDWICLSPKKFKKPLLSVLQKANELKVVIYNKSDFDWAEENASLVAPTCKLFLQPEWGKSAAVTPLIIEYIKSKPKWQFSLQLHKYIQVP